MINLLPYDTKKQTVAAHMNVALVRYIVVSGAALAFLVLACITTYFFINNAVVSNGKSTENIRTVTAKPAPQQNQANNFTADLVTARTILDQQVSYSDTLSEIASALPAGTVLESLSLNDSSFSAPMTLVIHARTADLESKIKENFQKSSSFSNFRVVSTTNDKSGLAGYPISVTISMTIKKDVNL